MPANLFAALQDPNRPLADRLRPQRLAAVVGQDHLLGPSGALGQVGRGKRLTSLVLWGPPGCGKTTIARLLAQETGLLFVQLSAVMAGVAELRKVFESARAESSLGRQTLLFVDEIHRFNKGQQDALLPHVEDGTVVLVGATTENPSFELNAALLSRCAVHVLRRLDAVALEQLLVRAEAELAGALPITAEARQMLLGLADGDGRFLLNLVEQIANRTVGEAAMDTQALLQLVQRRRPVYDKSGDQHYNLMSALHKSVRGSDVDAALYWFARMLDAGEDPRFIARRLTRMATEDIGLASPQALMVCIAAWQTFERLGTPEGELALAEALIYLATAPKSNACALAYDAARAAAKATGSLAPPLHILSAATSLMESLGYGEGYKYDHDEPNAFSGQHYFPDGMARPTFYQPAGRGFEREVAERMAIWAKLRAAHLAPQGPSP